MAVTHGGFMARMRDLARFGLLFTGYFKDDDSSEVALEPKLLEVLRGVFGTPPPGSRVSASVAPQRPNHLGLMPADIERGGLQHGP